MTFRGLLISFIVKAKFRRKALSPFTLMLLLFSFLAFFTLSQCSFSNSNSSIVWHNITSDPSAKSGPDSITCVNGFCVDSHCQCLFGWQGADCGQCGGRIL